MTDYDPKVMGEDHLHYELQMCIETHNLIRSGNLMILDQTIKNAVFESFAVRSRLLIEFFYGKPEKDDCSVLHFIEQSKEKIWEEFSRKQTSKANFNNLRMIVNKQVAHLTYFRLSNENTNWYEKAKEIANDYVIPAIEKLAELHDPTKVGPKLRALLKLSQIRAKQI